MWRLNPRTVEQVPPNVMLFDWIPQNDLLGHRNVKLFITHCGRNGQFEALYHGKPAVGHKPADVLGGTKQSSKEIDTTRWFDGVNIQVGRFNLWYFCPSNIALVVVVVVVD